MVKLYCFLDAGGFGVDFSYNTDTVEDGLLKVAKGILAHGVTAFCPTVVTSPTHVYHQVHVIMFPYTCVSPGTCHIVSLHMCITRYMS